MKGKKDNRTIPKIANDHATILIAKHGIEKAEIIAKLTYQKVKAQVNVAKEKYGE